MRLGSRSDVKVGNDLNDGSAKVKRLLMDVYISQMFKLYVHHIGPRLKKWFDCLNILKKAVFPKE